MKIAQFRSFVYLPSKKKLEMGTKDLDKLQME